ncbi:hypothetical protein DWW36_12335 [Erysipelotrichaceae bacterium AF15-26LB]|nr:bacteriophage Gp15 family protein [[Clostridium] innocuum]RJV87118.1 hypothetical protein DWW36_12335 [Erysipelotrichaceae bacterium AF15-26LB]
MINALFEEYPEALYIDGEYYKISTDFRRWIALNEAMLDKTLSEEEKGCIAMSLFKDEVPDDYNSAIISIAEFLQGNIIENEYKSTNKKSRYVFSFTYDQDYIIGAFKECYGIDILNIPYMHWWHFNALLNSLNSSCELKQRIMYRSIRLSDIIDKKERNRIRKIQRQIAIPAPELNDEEIASVF